MMLLHQSGFVTICPKKELDLHAADHRADHADQLKAEISWEAKGATGSEFAFLPGGAVRALNPNSSMTLAKEGECIAVFKGNLHNKAELALGLVGVPPHVTEAQLLLHLYASAGLDMLRLLQGQFAFCLYDSKQARVLAARDHSGAVPLLEGRTAAGSLIIACGTFLPDGVTQMVDIGPGEYKYGWHALPRSFQCGAGKIVAGRASCDYGIRRRSIDAYSAPARPSVSRTVSLDGGKPGGRSQHSPAAISHSLPHTPGRYMPPHLAAAAAAGGSGSWGRQRATSCDGGHPPATPPTSGSSGSGRRRSDTNPQSHGSHQQGHKHGHGHGQQQWLPKSPLAVVPPASPAAASPAAAPASKPSPVATAAGATTPRSSQTSALTRELLASPVDGAAAASADTAPAAAATSDASTPRSGEGHRRKRRHHRRSRKQAAAGGEGAAAGDGHSSDAESQVSSSTLDSVSSGALPAAAGAAGAGAASAAAATPAGKQASNRRSSKDGGARPIAAAAVGKPGAGMQQQHKVQQQPQQQQRRGSGSGGGNGSGGGFQRTGSCSELAAMGSSPTTHAALLAGPQPGLAC